MDWNVVNETLIQCKQVFRFLENHETAARTAAVERVMDDPERVTVQKLQG
ncbi:hypothetical protein [Nitrincola tibetensis]|nr:hypothetical protein [Nitrincola tibetensis]